MARYVLRRLLGSLLVMVVIITASFVLVRSVPGNPFAKDRGVDEITMRAKLAEYHLDKPIFPVFVTPDPEAVASGTQLPVHWGDEGAPGMVVLAPLVQTIILLLLGALVVWRTAGNRVSRTFGTLGLLAVTWVWFSAYGGGAWQTALIAFAVALLATLIVNSRLRHDRAALIANGAIFLLLAAVLTFTNGTDVNLIVEPSGIARTQYATYMGHLLQGDLGPSFQQERSVAEILFGDALVCSLTLGAQAMLIALVIGVPAGLIAGLRQNQWPDYTAMTGAMIGVSIPNFVLAPILILVFAIGLGWFDPGRWDEPKDLVLPSLALGMYFAAYVARLARAGTLEVIRQDYIRTARAKGLAERVVLVRHTLKGALLPVVSYLGPAFAAMLTGSVVIERIFSLPGVGAYFVDAALNRDYNLVLGTVILYSTLLVLLNLVVDLLYTVLDPRVSYD